MKNRNDKRVAVLLVGCLAAAFVATATFAQSRRDSGRDSGSSRDSGRDSSSRDSGRDSRSSGFDQFGGGSGGSRFSGSSSTTPPTTRPAFGPNVGIERYASLTSKNIFMKDRRLRPPTPPPSTQQAVSTPREVRTPQQMFRLTGLALQEGRNVAFIEDSRGNTERKVQGDAIAGGTIVHVDLDSLEYEANGKRVRVVVGHNLAGEVASAASIAAATTSSTTTQPSGTAGATTTPVDPNDPNLSAAERMKARRAAQGGQ